MRSMGRSSTKKRGRRPRYRQTKRPKSYWAWLDEYSQRTLRTESFPVLWSVAVRTHACPIREPGHPDCAARDVCLDTMPTLTERRQRGRHAVGYFPKHAALDSGT